MSIWAKLKGTTQSPPRVSLQEMAWSWLGSLLGIGAVAGLNHLYFTGTPWTLIVGSFGASASLIYGAIKSPLAQPRNLVGGQVLSALVGVTVQMALPGLPWLAAPLAVAFAVVVMHATKTLHPPGGAGRPDNAGRGPGGQQPACQSPLSRILALGPSGVARPCAPDLDITGRAKGLAVGGGCAQHAVGLGPAARELGLCCDGYNLTV